jgi:glycosyltransferase involved in cell wall biosynthesis
MLTNGAGSTDGVTATILPKLVDGAAPPGRHGGGAPHRRLHIAMVHLSDFRYDSRIQRQATALAERGDTVELVCLGPRDEVRIGEGLIRVHPVGGDKPTGGVGGYLRGYARFLARAAARLTALELREHFDLVEVHNMPDALTLAALVPKLRGAAVILNLHDTFPELLASKFDRPQDGWEVKVLKLEERCSAAVADRLITVTDEARVRLAQRGVGVGTTHIVMNSPDEGVFGPPRAPIVLPSEGPLRVLYHGGTARRYGVESLIRAFGRLQGTAPRVTLRVCGTGVELPILRELAAAVAPDRVEVVGPIPFDAIPAELDQAHIGVVSTVHDRFTELLLPVKLLEYIHMGLPVVASRLPGITGYFSDEEARLFTPGDSDALAAAIEDVCANPGAAQQRAARAAERLQTIAWKQQLVGYLELVDGLVSGRSAKQRVGS